MIPPSPSPPTRSALCDQSSGIERGANGSKGPWGVPHLAAVRNGLVSRSEVGGSARARG